MTLCVEEVSPHCVLSTISYFGVLLSAVRLLSCWRFVSCCVISQQDANKQGDFNLAAGKEISIRSGCSKHKFTGHSYVGCNAPGAPRKDGAANMATARSTTSSAQPEEEIGGFLSWQAQSRRNKRVSNQFYYSLTTAPRMATSKMNYCQAWRVY